MAKKVKTYDWLVTTYNNKDKVIGAFIVKDRTEKEAEDESIYQVSMKGVHDWTMMEMGGELERFCEEWGQDDEEAASALGFDAEDDGFSELMINHDYIWIEPHNVWVAENSRLYDKRDDVVIEYIKQKKATSWK